LKILLGFAFIISVVLGGFLLHHGNLWLLIMPSEYMIIVGMMIGTLFVGNPFSVMKHLMRALMGLLKGASIGRKHYVEVLRLLYELFQLSRKEGVLALESHVNDPAESEIFKKYPYFMSDGHAVEFLCDTLKLFVAGVVDPHNMDDLMERDLEVIHHEELQPSHALQRSADGLPAIGIVAAVLGIILTMQSIDQGAAAVGRKVAGALVGTFLGVFLAYGFVGPLASALEAVANARDRYYQVIRQVLSSAVGGMNPAMAVEIGRRSIATADRPTFDELEETLRAAKASAAAGADGSAGGEG
jgi:chemotaxis protein MotA